MRQRHLVIGVVILIGVLGALATLDIVRAQIGLGPVVDFLGTRNPSNSQRTTRVDSTVSPARTEIGVDVANYIRMAGMTTASAPTLRMVGDANTGLRIVPAGTGTVEIDTAWTDFKVFYAATIYCSDYTSSTAAVNTRIAGNDAALARTATGAETHNIICDLPFFFERTTVGKGVKVDGVSLSYFVGTAALTTHAIQNAALVTYANATANSVDTGGLSVTGTLQTATQATPYLSAMTVVVGYLNRGATALNLELQAVMANTGIYRLFGIYVTYRVAL